MIKIFMMSSFHGMMTGQSLVSKKISESTLWDVVKISNGGEGLSAISKIILALRSLLTLCGYSLVDLIISTNVDRILYFTCSRSRLGFYRELPALIISKIFNMKVVNHLHGADLADFYLNMDIVTQFLIRWIYNKIDAHVVLLPAMKSQFDSILSHSSLDHSIFVVPNFHEAPQRNKELASLPSKSVDKIKLVFLSNLIPSKGFIELLDAFELLPNQYRERFDLTIAGGKVGGCDVKIQERIRCYESIEDIHIVGPVYGDAKWRLLQCSDVFVFPSYYPTEAFPLVLLEAAAAGCYIITTKHNFLPDLMEHFSGNLVESKSSESIRNALMAVLDNFSDVTRGKLLNVERASAFSYNNFERNMNDVFTAVLKRGKNEG